ncbi:MAG: HIT family protein [Candidatus Nealsonbacteria bacterium CG_4_9_14_3_um_filter_35_11]|uniref:HIT family protein n=2 Tax=Candidatus Nealsoniibacteriota TaxID=1817911 RepID=A0A2M7DB93_9BACT|nr:MAG: HIT family protein [Candidatus Nealsonbacteria bacterium CG11_big_fil_rev_8_21_14_0_20_35_11]PIV45700.1 MAG: HIT family protein [Candidatus Nealsonbacteria bacterium CG02_land_8_20_14_3_00_34_20]PIW92541.1 MAG: HIT family protein [Candidatus Nealsonbacteria bacterium CG_4_8_14_3_um_filter_34_13]PIZ89800.1 MAG: HIT family protein [Candidatus Nealsonbacteria bacterium CG_4_10_14_0_2_um_filter_35_20]PJA84600.1 MAG: HIT family protein [Candidatus Nealsonbacteria bacterium CG_4_9_14_3_um_fil
MENCIFCQIIKKELPASIIFEDEQVLAFLEINPLAEGHTLVVPKEHFENIFDIEEDLLKKIIFVSKKISEKMKEALGTEGVNLVQRSGIVAEQGVFHFHLHIIPRKKNDNINLENWWRQKTKEISPEKLEEIASKLAI